MLRLHFIPTSESAGAYLQERFKKSWMILAFALSFMTLTVLLELSLPLLIGLLFDQITLKTDTTLVDWMSLNPSWLGVLFLYLVLGYGCLTFAYRYVFASISSSDMTNIRNIFWNQISKLESPYLKTHKKDHFTTLMQDSAIFSGFYSSLLIQGCQIALTSFFLIILMGTKSPAITLTYWLFLTLMAWKKTSDDKDYKKLVSQHRHENAKVMDTANDLAKNGQRYHWANMQNYASRISDTILKSYLKMRERSATHLLKIEVLLSVGFYVALTAVTASGVLLVKQGHLSGGDALSLIILAGMARMPIDQFAMFWGAIQRFKVASQRLRGQKHALVPTTSQNTTMNIEMPFSDTLEENLSLGAKIHKDTITDALDIFELRDEFSSQGITPKSNLGHWRQKLSLGQCQRLGLARRWIHSDNFQLQPAECDAIDQAKIKRIKQNLKHYDSRSVMGVTL